jgi:hypothetical protein
MVTFVVLCTSNILTITWVDSHELLIKLITMEKVSYPTYNIQRSKEVVHVNTRYKRRLNIFFFSFVHNI